MTKFVSTRKNSSTEDRATPSLPTINVFETEIFPKRRSLLLRMFLLCDAKPFRTEIRDKSLLSS